MNYRKLRLNLVRWGFLVTFAAMIQELPIHEDSWTYTFDEPLLEYVRKVAENYWMDIDDEIMEPMGYSSVPRRFASRYLNGEIDITSKDLYCNCVTPRATHSKHVKYYDFYSGKEERKDSDGEDESIPDISMTFGKAARV